MAPGLRPPPADLVVHVLLHADHDLFQTISDGIAGTAMAPFGGHMSALRWSSPSFQRWRL
jgi:hypothetical protein